MSNSSSNRGNRPKKSLLTVKRSPIAWNRFNLKVISSESKDQLFLKITKAINTGAILGRDIIAGANSVTRLLERNRAAVIAVCRDSNHTITDHIIEAARLRKVPAVFLPKCVQELATLLNLKRISCFAISVELDEETLLAELNLKKLRKEGLQCKSKKRKHNECHTAVSADLDRALQLVGSGHEIRQTNDVDSHTSNSKGLLTYMNVENKETEATDEVETEEVEPIVRSDSEIAAALILPACMDDLRDAMINMAS